MELVPVITMWLLSLVPSSFENEPEIDRKARIEIVAEAFASVADEMMCEGEFDYRFCKKLWRGSYVDLILALGTQAWHESKVAAYIQAGNCRPWECDPVFVRDKRGTIVLDEDGKPITYFLARSMFQCHESTPEAREMWHLMIGNDYEAVRASTWVMASFFRRNYCGGNIAGMFSSGSGKGCAVSERGQLRYAWFLEERRNFKRMIREREQRRLVAAE